MRKRSILPTALMIALTAVGLVAGYAAASGPPKLDPALPGYKAVSGVSGNVSSIGSDSLNNLMTLWAESFGKFYPNAKIQIEGKGSSTAPPALISGTAQLGPMSREMKGTEVDGFEKKYGYKPTPIRTSVDALAVFVNKDNPIKCMTMAQVDAVFSKSRRYGHKEDIKTWGQLGLTGRMGQQAHQPLRPQLGVRDLRLLQGARAQERGLQGRGEGAAGLGLGGAGRDGGPLRHGVQRHRLRHRGRPRGAAGREGGRQVLRGRPRQRLCGELSALALPLRLREQGAGQAAGPADPGVREADGLEGRARRS